MTEFWRMGGWPVPVRETARVAARFEEWGWDGLAVPNGPAAGADPYVTCALAASGTTKLKVGTATAVPNRHPLLLANSMATVQGVSDGRAVFTLGRGDEAMEHLNRPMMPVPEFSRYLAQLRGYLHRERVEVDGFETTMRPLFSRDPSLNVDPPPVGVTATGPRVARLGALEADGLTLAVGADPTKLWSMINHVREARVEAGMNPFELRLGCYVHIAVGEGLDLEYARDIVRGSVLQHARMFGMHGRFLDLVDDQDRVTVSRAIATTRERGRWENERGPDWNSYGEGVLGDDFLDRFAIVGPPEICIQRLQEIVDQGFERVILVTRSAGQDLLETNASRVAEEVLPFIERYERTDSTGTFGGSYRR